MSLCLFSHAIKILFSCSRAFFAHLKEEIFFFALSVTLIIIIFYVETQLRYKNQLQEYAQKRGKLLPSYRPIHGGSLRAPLFKSEVTIDGQTFESPEYCRTMKEAETAAAKVALMFLPQEAGPTQQLPVGPFLFLFTFGEFS
jgi:hypothetical protein